MAAELDNGDIIIVDRSIRTSALVKPGTTDADNGFFMDGVGYIFGKAFVVGQARSGQMIDVSSSIDDLQTKIRFGEDPFISTFTDMLTQNGIDIKGDLHVDNQFIPIYSVISMLGLLPEDKKTEVMMLSQIDIESGVNPTLLLTTFAKNLGGHLS